MNKLFRNIADKTAEILGAPLTFILTCLIIVVWLVIYALSGWEDSINLAANIVISIVTLLTLLILQNSQNRNDRATHLKLDEILHAISEAREDFIKAEQKDDEELEELVSKIDEC